LPDLADIPFWQIVAAIALGFMNASWGQVAFRVIGAIEPGASTIAVFLYLASGIYITSIFLMGMSLMRFREDVKRAAAGIWLFILIAYLPAILYPQLQIGHIFKLERYLARIFQLNFLFTTEFLGSVIVIYFWRIGLTLSNYWIGTLAVGRYFRTSTILMIALGFVATSMGFIVPVLELFLLLFSGLMAMSSARISSAGFKRGGGWTPFRSSFFIIFIFSAAGVIALILALTNAVSGPIAAFVNRLIFVIGVLFSWVAVVAFGPIFIFILGLVERILNRLKPFAGTIEEEIAPAMTELQAMLQEAAQETQPFPFAARINEILGLLLPILGIVLLLSLGYYALKRTRAARLWENLDRDEREKLVGSLPDFLRSLFLRGARSSIGALSELLPVSRVIAAARIRQIYRHLLRESARLGMGREDAETPLEFLSDLQIVFPGCEDDLSLVTSAYLKVRYGEYPETRREVEEVEQAWKNVRRHGQAIRTVEQSA
jgi:hypothetical protein